MAKLQMMDKIETYGCQHSYPIKHLISLLKQSQVHQDTKKGIKNPMPGIPTNLRSRLQAIKESAEIRQCALRHDKVFKHLLGL